MQVRPHRRSQDRLERWSAPLTYPTKSPVLILSFRSNQGKRILLLPERRKVGSVQVLRVVSGAVYASSIVCTNKRILSSGLMTMPMLGVLLRGTLEAVALPLPRRVPVPATSATRVCTLFQHYSLKLLILIRPKRDTGRTRARTTAVAGTRTPPGPRPGPRATGRVPARASSAKKVCNFFWLRVASCGVWLRAAMSLNST